jgi:hypothetical protein
MSPRLLHLTVVACAVFVVSVLVVALGVVGARTDPGTVHLRGTAYEFNRVHVLLGGATIRVAEFPKLRARVEPDGRYDLVVPAHSSVTPYIVDAGYHTIYLQTFRTNGEDLANVNFQTPTEAVYRALVALLKVPVDSHGNLVACAVVSTFNTRNVRDLGFARFIAYGAHGVAGATAAARPALPTKPVYFNKDVLPDPARTDSSKDGGVVWTRVPTGVYTITAHDPSTRFASFVATCRPGRVVNANPPWGLYQLAPPNPARISARWWVNGARTRVRALSARQLPSAAVVTAICKGRGCRFESRTFRPKASKLDLRRAIGSGKLRLRAGDTFEVTISAHAFNGLVARWAVGKRRAPTRVTFCIPLGYSLPRQHCPTS